MFLLYFPHTKIVLSRPSPLFEHFPCYLFAARSNMSSSRVFIGHLSTHARERDVEKFFKGYGHIREINLKNGFGFVVSVASPFGTF